MPEQVFPAAGGKLDSAVLAGLLQVTGEDHLRLSAWSAFSEIPLTLGVRFRQLSGLGQVGTQTFKTHALPFTKSSVVVPLGNGHLLNARIAVDTTGIAVRRGDVFVQLELVRGLSGAVIPLGTLIQGYVAREASLAWPGNPLTSPYDGPGRAISIVDANPPFGVGWTFDVPAGVRWRLLALRCALVTSATVADRFLWTRIRHGGDVVFDSGGNAAQVASTTQIYTFADGLTGLVPAGALVLSGGLANNTIVQFGDRLEFLVTAIQAGDSLILPTIWAEQWLDP